MMHDYDIAVIGGGLLGSAFAWGLARRCQKVVVFDEGDAAIRSARGNFGLVWVQGKGSGMPQYSSWSLRGSQLWGDLAEELQENTGVDVCYVKEGYNIAASEAELEAAVNKQNKIQTEMGGAAYNFEILDHKSLKSHAPQIAPSVPGAIYTGHDGHCNPLFLMRALHQDLQTKGATYHPNSAINKIIPIDGGGFAIHGYDGQIMAHAGKVVISAGHGAKALVSGLGIDLPVYADQGQVLVTEKIPIQMRFATGKVRQTDNGSFLLGASSKDIGMDTRTDMPTMAQVAKYCTSVFPFLGKLRLQRAWAALRVMTPDGCPIYQQSSTHPGLFSFACHSGVTLASTHAYDVAGWIIDGAIPQNYAIFHPRRFHV